ncbi:MAG: TraR/DksA family transcriptional regulator [Gammaproteobacteria bacterium]
MTASLLTDQDRAELAGAIETRMATLRAEIVAGLRQSDDPSVLQLANHFEETDDAAVASLELATEIAAVERDVQELAALERARERLRAGSYGTCADCGTAIPLARLRAQPSALRCLTCQNAAERASGAHAPPRL